MARSTKSESSGFTLLEMIIALFILALVLGTAAVSMKNVLGDENLRDAARELEFFAKTARSQALQLNQNQELILLPEAWELRRMQNDDQDEKQKDPQILSYQLPKSVTWKIKTWGSTEWKKPENLSWIFTSAGLCAPHRFRFESKNSWMEMSFNPLTGNTELEEFYLP